MTPEQEKDAERLDRYIIREGLSSLMNDTKWREVMDIVQEVMGNNIRFRIKDVRGTEQEADHWTGSFPYHVPQPYKTIEWFEIATIVEQRIGNPSVATVQDLTESLVHALRTKHIPFYPQEGTIRIPGYIRTTKLDN